MSRLCGVHFHAEILLPISASLTLRNCSDNGEQTGQQPSGNSSSRAISSGSTKC
jgi:hypothetical protein